MSLIIRNPKPLLSSPIRALTSNQRGNFQHWLQQIPEPRPVTPPPRTSSATPFKPQCAPQPPAPPSPPTPLVQPPWQWRAKLRERHEPLQQLRLLARQLPRPEPAREQLSFPSVRDGTAPRVPETLQHAQSSAESTLRRLRLLRPRIRPMEQTPEALAEQQHLERLSRQREHAERMVRVEQRCAAQRSEYDRLFPTSEPALEAVANLPPSPEPASDPQSDEDTAQDITPPPFFDDDEPELRDRSNGRSPDRWCALSPLLSIIPEQTEHSQSTASTSFDAAETSQSGIVAPSPCEGLSNDTEYRAQFQRVVGASHGYCMHAAIAGLPVRDEVKDETSLITGYSSPQMEPLRPISPQPQPLQPEPLQFDEESWLSEQSSLHGNEDTMEAVAKAIYWSRRHGLPLPGDRSSSSRLSPEAVQKTHDSTVSLDEPALHKVTFAARDSSPVAPAPSAPVDLFGDILNDIDVRRSDVAANPSAINKPDEFADIILREEPRLPAMVNTTTWFEEPREQKQPGMLSKIKTRAMAIVKTAWSKIMSLVRR